jgi:hypothetical protein
LAPAIDAFITKWAASGASERANKDAFLLELCDVLDVPHPSPTTGDPEKDTYVFEKDAVLPHEGGTTTIGKIDLYKAEAFILEAKQGSDATSKKLGSAKRGTPGWAVAMNGAYGQALGYARSFDKPVPFLVVCDIGYSFDLYASFDGSGSYRPFPDATRSRLFFKDFPDHKETLRRVFVDPLGLDPSRVSAKVTREVAGHLAELAKALEAARNPPDVVAQFLMRCLFTMFAEDVGLLPERLFTDAIKDHWLESPASFPGGIETLWRAMNEGAGFGFVGKLLRFNGGLFQAPSALKLTRDDLKLLLEAAECNWAEVEPAIFGTLLERALDPKERHALGAHYTPRAYVERLVKPTIEEPLRADWDVAQAEVRQLVAANKVEAAKKVVRTFHQKLCATKVLDPACGSGNFLYVTLDLFMRLEGEVLALLAGLGETQTLLHADTIRVRPKQFLGIEVKPWAKEIAELVLWIGYLQHHFRAHGKAQPPLEPVLQDYKNIECRDAVLAWDRIELVRDEAGKPVTRWDGETYKKSAVTGEDVPDETARREEYRYVNPRKAEWPKADFIVGNPPFVGNKRMRDVLGEGYVEALRGSYADVPEASDYVMYWWRFAARRVIEKESYAAGLITTNSITQSFNRQVVERCLTEGLTLRFAIADHPWVESRDGAAVRVAMTVFARGLAEGRVMTIVDSGIRTLDDPRSLRTRTGLIHADLSVGVDVLRTTALSADIGLAFQGPIPVGEGFRIDADELSRFGLTESALPPVVRPYLIGRDLAQRPAVRFIIDFFGYTAEQAQATYPALMQKIVDEVKPDRVANTDRGFRERWWLWGRPRPEMRAALAGLRRYIATCRTARHRVFVFVRGEVVPDTKIIAVATDLAWVLGALSSRAHVVWSNRTGGFLGVGHDPTYNHADCFNKFPFPAPTDAQTTRIHALGESLDAHRKRQQALHPELTITGMYNVLEKLRAGEALTAKEKVVHEQGLVSVLKQIHDDLDAAVFDAYGWPHDLSDEQILERLVALNAERAEEERNGLIRWLRPEFQNPSGTKAATQTAMAGVEEEASEEAAPAATASWPKKMAEQVGVVRDLVAKSGGEWTAAQGAKAFKGAKPKDVEEVLDALVAVGVLAGYGEGKRRKWRGVG